MIPHSELADHASKDNLWIVVNDKVYDMTKFAPEHPGGEQIILEYAGRDASKAYAEVHAPSLISRTLSQEEQKGDFDWASAPEGFKDEGEEDPELITAPEGKPPLETLINLQDFADAAEKSLSTKNWAFISGGANDNITRDANSNLYESIWFRPRALRNVSVVSTEATMMGQKVSLPVWIAPTGIGTAGGEEGEIAFSQSASASGIIHMISTNASFPIDEILEAAKPNYPFFFQLYINKDRSKTEELLKVINNQPQIKAIFVTVDLPVVSKREADERIKNMKVQRSSISGTSSSSDSKGSGLARSVGSFIDPAFCWDDLVWLRKHTKLPIILKGIQCAADARQAMLVGCQGIVVSNHGGRALDTGPGSILVLLELHKECPEVFDRMEVYIDGGIRRGSDLLKALCLGASGVGLGRPYMYALSYGREGVDHLTNVLRDEVETAMRLCGLQNLDEVDPCYVNTSQLDPLVPHGENHPYARKHRRVKPYPRL